MHVYIYNNSQWISPVQMGGEVGGQVVGTAVVRCSSDDSDSDDDAAVSSNPVAVTKKKMKKIVLVLVLVKDMARVVLNPRGRMISDRCWARAYEYKQECVIPHACSTQEVTIIAKFVSC
jgi:hypothetical protein